MATEAAPEESMGGNVALRWKSLQSSLFVSTSGHLQPLSSRGWYQTARSHSESSAAPASLWCPSSARTGRFIQHPFPSLAETLALSVIRSSDCPQATGGLGSRRLCVGICRVSHCWTPVPSQVTPIPPSPAPPL